MEYLHVLRAHVFSCETLPCYYVLHHHNFCTAKHSKERSHCYAIKFFPIAGMLMIINKAIMNIRKFNDSQGSKSRKKNYEIKICYGDFHIDLKSLTHLNKTNICPTMI